VADRTWHSPAQQQGQNASITCGSVACTSFKGVNTPIKGKCGTLLASLDTFRAHIHDIQLGLGNAGDTPLPAGRGTMKLNTCISPRFTDVTLQHSALSAHLQLLLIANQCGCNPE
jgi:hypothetical protein